MLLLAILNDLLRMVLKGINRKLNVKIIWVIQVFRRKALGTLRKRKETALCTI
jgi:hypothetical protein